MEKSKLIDYMIFEQKITPFP